MKPVIEPPKLVDILLVLPRHLRLGSPSLPRPTQIISFNHQNNLTNQFYQFVWIYVPAALGSASAPPKSSQPWMVLEAIATNILPKHTI